MGNAYALKGILVQIARRGSVHQIALDQIVKNLAVCGIATARVSVPWESVSALSRTWARIVLFLLSATSPAPMSVTYQEKLKRFGAKSANSAKVVVSQCRHTQFLGDTMLSKT